MELIHLTDNVYYLPGATNIGVIDAGGGQAVLVDTGIDQQMAKKIIKVLGEHKLIPSAVINTHSHADHIGGNAFLQSRLGIPVYATAGEAPFIDNPELEPLYLLGGTVPWKDMRNKFLCAGPSKVTPVDNEQNTVNVSGMDMQLCRLPGHSHSQTGVLFQGVLFSGDAFLAPEYLEKHGIPYNVDVQRFFTSLDNISSFNAAITVPGHGTPLSDPVPVLRCNRDTVMLQVEMVEAIIAENPSTIEGVVEKLCRKINFTIGLPSLYFLYRTSVTAYLGYLLTSKRAEVYVKGNTLYWKKMISISI